MQQNRPKLKLRTGPDTIDVLLHGVAHHLCVRATYNRGTVILAPHILYERHGEPHLDAMVIERDGVRPNEEKLGTFKVSGLRNAVTTSEEIRLFAGFMPDDARYAEKVLAVVGD